MTEYPQTFEDIEVGDVYELDGTYEVTEEEIVEFGRRWDPLPFHLDPEAAEESMFDGLVASGWHVCSMASRVIVDEFTRGTGSKGAVGLEDLRWHEPVRPGDVLRVELEIADKGKWYGDDGLVRTRVRVYADDELVLSYLGMTLWEQESGE